MKNKITKSLCIIMCLFIITTLAGCKKDKDKTEGDNQQTTTTTMAPIQREEQDASQKIKVYEENLSNNSYSQGILYNSSFIVAKGVFDNTLTYKDLMAMHESLQRRKDFAMKKGEAQTIVLPDYPDVELYFGAEEDCTLENAKIKKVSYNITKDTHLYIDCIGYQTSKITGKESILDDVLNVLGQPAAYTIDENIIRVTYTYQASTISVVYDTKENTGRLEICFL